MFDMTRGDSVLFIPSWPHGDEGLRDDTVYKCVMNYDNLLAEGLEYDFDMLLAGLNFLGKYYKDHEFGIRPSDEYIEGQGLIYDEEESLLWIWETFINDFVNDENDIEGTYRAAEKKVGEGVAAYQVLIRARRLCRLISLGAPEIILKAERDILTQAYFLHEFAESMEELPRTEVDEKDIVVF